MTLPIILVGGGGHAKVVLETLRISGFSPAGFVDPNPNATLLHLKRLGGDDYLEKLGSRDLLLAYGIGGIGANDRQGLYSRLRAKGYKFISVQHPSAILAEDTEIGDAVQLMAGSIVQPGTVIGENVLINTRASVDHDCVIADHTHIAPGSTLCGNVRIGSGVLVGAGSTVIQGKTIGDLVTIGAGACVASDVPAGTKALGIPAKIVSGPH